MNRRQQFIDYHQASRSVGDIDPQNACLTYLANRFELNEEQRHWLAFLFGCTYSAPTVFYIYNEFPDFENVNVARLHRWWSDNKHRCLFQTDRLRVKTGDLFVETFRSYRALLQGRSQSETFAGLRHLTPEGNYGAAWAWSSGIRNFGRFSLFIYLELVHELTKFKMAPHRLDVANALSSRNGLCYALGLDHLVDRKLREMTIDSLEEDFRLLCNELDDRAWSVETTLCAFKKHLRGKRWVGYYLDRQHDEIAKMQRAVPLGVCWDVLWQYRDETYLGEHLLELTDTPSTMETPYA